MKETWQFQEKKEMRCFPCPVPHGGCVNDVTAQSSGMWIPSAASVLATYIFCYFRFFGWIALAEPSREKRPRVIVASYLCLVVSQWLPGFMKCEAAVCWDASLKHTNLLAAWHSHLWAVCSFRTWFQVWEEGTGKKGHASASREWLSGLRCGTQGFQTIFLLILQCVHCYPVFLHGYITHPKVSLSMLEMGWEHLWLCVWHTFSFLLKLLNMPTNKQKLLRSVRH